MGGWVDGWMGEARGNFSLRMISSVVFLLSSREAKLLDGKRDN
jgi:hypothetical protein